jgi:integrase/recombinase XerD
LRIEALVADRIGMRSQESGRIPMILQSTGDIRKVALWLGHASTQTTEMYLRADTTTRLEIVNRTTPPKLRKGHFRPPDQLIALLKAE